MGDKYSLLQEDLNEFELKCIDPIIKGLSNKIGKENAVSNNYIIDKMNKFGYIGLTPPRVRKIINHIRNNNLLMCVCANSKGYFLPKNMKELNDYMDTMEKRINSQIRTFDKLKEQSDMLKNYHRENV
jgi:hypothetical protein|tara:strand:+ start:303 stop:686 length:384 start_codon:yes stop_codon:yes gene_type:complete